MRLLLLLLAGFLPLQADGPIYLLLTHPRATATAFEKVMRTHGMQALHAPYLDPYLLKKYGPNHVLTSSLKDTGLTYEDVTRNIFTMAKSGPLFFKESGYLILDYFKQTPSLYKNPQVKIAFLIRDPAKSILSYYKRMPSVSEPIIGHRQLWDLYLFLKEQGINAPVIDSDLLLKNPLKILNQLGTHWNLHFDESNLQWESGFAEEWHVKEWYVEVAYSTALKPYQGDLDRDSDGVPTYLEVTNESDRARLQDIFRIQNGYYQKFLQYVIQ